MKRIIFDGALFARDVKFIREYEGKTLREFSEMTEISIATLSRVENENTPDVLTMFKLCDLMKQPMNKYFKTPLL